jgi:formylglycine-generating enzyme required for sulfatase activity
MLLIVVAGLAAYLNHDALGKQWHWLAYTRPFMNNEIKPHVLKTADEKALKPGEKFRECSDKAGTDFCPQMIVIPAGPFLMGSPPTDRDRDPKEEPQHPVNIGYAFAVSIFKVTFAEWETCIANDGCDRLNDLREWGTPKQPVIYLNWRQATQYVGWLSHMTGKPYRLLSEAEYEYATRAGSQTRYPWGDDVGNNNAQCANCGSATVSRPVAVDAFPANAFGLVEMLGNVWEWVGDCYHPSYHITTDKGEVVDAPNDGSAWTEPDCHAHAVRGGSWFNDARGIRSASRDITEDGGANFFLGFRVARSLAP